MNILTFFIFANQVLHIFGKLTILRGSFIYKNPDCVKLICLSEDDGGALVWNHNLIWKYSWYARQNNLRKSLIKIDISTFITCEVKCIYEFHKLFFHFHIYIEILNFVSFKLFYKSFNIIHLFTTYSL